MNNTKETIPTQLIHDFIAEIDNKLLELKEEHARLSSIKPLIGPDKKRKKLIANQIKVKISSRVVLKQLLDRGDGIFTKRSKEDEERLLRWLCM